MTYLNPTTNTHKPLEGKGCFEAKIHFKSILLGSDDAFLIRNLFYEYLETGSGLRVIIENPDIQNSSSLIDDVRTSIQEELRYTVPIDLLSDIEINFYEPTK